MTLELNLRFPQPDQVVVRLGDDETAALPFQSPLTPKDHADLRWYVETYGPQPMEGDDPEAERVKQRLPAIGKALFKAVFGDETARRLFNRFQDEEQENRLLTVSAEHPMILGLPWELLHESAAPDGTHLFHETISLRRRFAGAGGGRKPFKLLPKDRLHLLFVISRPDDAGFINPRADAEAVMDALDAQAQGRVSAEFLRPPTLDALRARLDDDRLPPVDILHFDGHGVFDADGGILREQNRRGGRTEDLMRDASDKDGAPDTGYLLFEDGDGQSHLVSAADLGANLHRRKVGLVILSACQSAALGEAEPLGSVAARLTATGIPAVLAMTHSVLVVTTLKLFAEFYKQLGQGKALGEALDAARRHLANHPEKYRVRRDGGWEWLKLHDWFLPALYQGGEDVPMLQLACRSGLQPATDRGLKPAPTLLPAKPEAGFFGRNRELWDIERWFAEPDPHKTTRRISVTGFGGQGKTALALEAGRWLLRKGLFRAAVFVNYAETPSRDAVAVAISAMSAALGRDLHEVADATAALRETPSLLILDNLEALDAETLKLLLDAALDWSQAGGSRVLLTSRRPDFRHPAYRVEGSRQHRRILLDGLQPADALDWHEELRKLPPPPPFPAPDRDALAALFAQVRFHPLSIRVLAAQLKTRRIAELSGRLQQLLADARLAPPSPSGGGVGGEASEDLPAHLIASLHLSLERLDATARARLPKLGVFQGGAMEPDLLEVTGIAAADWAALRQQLEAAALVEPESLPDVTVPFLRFHPTLAPLLWLELDAAQQEALSAAHRAHYHGLAGYLYHEDDRNPHAARAIARRELPNLLHAVRAALQRAEADAVDFADSVNRFLGYFGLRREQAELTRLAGQQAPDTGSRAWYLAQSNRGEQLRTSGRIADAAQVFASVLEPLGETASYERAQTLGWLGRCFRAAGRPDQAAQLQQQALAVLDMLEPTESVKRQRGTRLTDLADALTNMGQYQDARQAYLAGLAIAEELHDMRQQGVVLGQLGSLALEERQFDEAARRYREALTLFQTLQEPNSEAIVWHQLGGVYQEARQWAEAERCYRESAHIKETLGNKSGAAATWNQLALVNQSLGKLEAAETWYRKAIAVYRANNNPIHLAAGLNNLADLLRTQPQRLTEARRLAEQALALKQTLEPGAAEIWKAYDRLADIAEQEAATSTEAAQQQERQLAAQDYRRQSQDAYRAFPGNRAMLKSRAHLILVATASGLGQADALPLLAGYQQQMRAAGPAWTALADALDRVLAGERDTEALCAGLNFEKALILETILQGIADPASLAWLQDGADGDAA